MSNCQKFLSTLIIFLIISIYSACENSFAILIEEVGDKNREIISSNFNSIPVGGTPSNLLINEEEGNLSVSNFPSFNNRSLMFDDTATPGGIDADFIVPDQHDMLTIEIDLCSLPNAHVFAIKLQNDRTPAVKVELDSNGKMSYYYNLNDSSEINYLPGIWYRLKIETDIQSLKYKIYLDDSMISEANFINGVTKIDRVSFKSDYFNQGTVYIDNILLY